MEADALSKEMSKEGSHVILMRFNKAPAVGQVRALPSISTVWGMNGLGAVLQSWTGG